jgi:hypothetical protein
MSTAEFRNMVIIILASNEGQAEGGGGTESNYYVPFPPLIPCTSFTSATNY